MCRHRMWTVPDPVTGSALCLDCGTESTISRKDLIKFYGGEDGLHRAILQHMDWFGVENNPIPPAWHLRLLKGGQS